MKISFKHVFVHVCLLVQAAAGTAARADSSPHSDLDQWFGGDSPIFSQVVPTTFAAAQQRLRVVRGQIAALLRGCLADSGCALDAPERSLVERILSKVGERGFGELFFADGHGRFTPPLSPEERQRLTAGGFHLDDTLFVSGAQEANRFAVTQLAPGPIVFNNDQLSGSLAFGTLIALLTHELGHQVGALDTADRPLDRLGAKVAAAVGGWTEDAVLEGQPIEAFLSPVTPRDPRAPLGAQSLFFSDGSLGFDLYPLVDAVLYRVVDVPNLDGYGLSNLRFRGVTDGQLYLESDLEYRLSNAAGSRLAINGTVQFAIPLSGGHYDGSPITISAYDLRDTSADTLLGLELVSIDARPVVAEGTPIELTATVKTRPGQVISAAMAVLKSDDFLVHPIIVPLRAYLDAKTIAPSGDGGTRLSFTFQFLPGTPARTFRIDSILVSVAGENTPAQLFPRNRTTLHYEARTPAPAFRYVDAQVYTVSGTNPFDMLPKVQDNNAFIPLSSFPGGDNAYNSADVQIQFDIQGNIPKAILVLEGQSKTPSGELTSRPFLVALGQQTQDGVLRSGAIEHLDNGQTQLKIDLNPKRLPADFVSIRFRGIKIVNSYLQEGYFPFFK